MKKGYVISLVIIGLLIGISVFVLMQDLSHRNLSDNLNPTKTEEKKATKIIKTMRQTRTILTALMLLATTVVMAQTTTVKGTVMDKNLGEGGSIFSMYAGQS